MTKLKVLVPKNSFFCSSQETENKFQTFENFLKWFETKKTKFFSVEQVPFDELDQWSFTPNNHSLVHKSGRFFMIEGVRVQTNFGGQKVWEQPIINQPEIGILGILTKVIDGVRYFLMQAKMEPGNINILQLSPTVQATKSNFSRVHKGKLPAYLEYFVDPTKSKTIIDQLQTEQGGRFLRKRNRNMVIEVNEEVEVLDDFCWLTLGEIKKLLKLDNFVNMDARSVISTIPFVDDSVLDILMHQDLSTLNELKINDKTYNGINTGLILSACSPITKVSSKDQIISWYTSMKVNYEQRVEQIPLSEVANWSITNDKIYNNDRFFTVIGVKVIAGTREVSSWTQPLIKDENIGLLGFILKEIDGIFHFLVQAKVEPGNLDVIELSPTVSCSNFDFLVSNPEAQPPFFSYFLKEDDSNIIIDALQSEEGGRFYQLQNRNMIIVIDKNEELELPDNYCWMTLNQMMDFMRYSMFNIEARSLISSIDINE